MWSVFQNGDEYLSFRMDSLFDIQLNIVNYYQIIDSLINNNLINEPLKELPEFKLFILFYEI